MPDNINKFKSDTDVSGRAIIGLPATLLIFVALTVFSFFLASEQKDLLSVIVIALFIVTSVLLTRSKTVITSSAILMVLGFFLTGSLTVVAYTVCLVGSIATGAYAFFGGRKAVLLISAPLAYVIAFALTQNAITSLFVLFTLPSTVALILAIKHGLSRIFAMSAVSIAFAATILAVFIASSYATNGTVSADQVLQFVEDLRSGIANALLTVSEQTFEQLAASNYEYENLITPKIADEIANTIISLIPAIFVTTCNVIAFLAHSLFISEFENSQNGSLLTSDATELKVSTVGAIVYIISFALRLFLPVGVASSVNENITSILTPVLAVCGLASIIASFRSKKIKIGPFGIVITVIVAINLAVYIPYLLAFFGVFSALKAKKPNNDRHTF